MSLLRLATVADQQAVLELFGTVPMQGELVLATRREPDYFALPAMQRGAFELWVKDRAQGGLDGMGALFVREAWLHGGVTRVGYLGDLRSRFSAQRARGLSLSYGQVLNDFARRHQVQVFLTAVMASNAAALQSLVRRKPARVQQPRYTLLRPFDAVSVHFTRRRKLKASPYTVRRARAEDLESLRSFLAADHAQRAWGYRFDAGELEHRLAHWPGYSLSSCFLAHDTQGQLVGCTTAWDPREVKRYQVLDYRGSMRWLYRGYRAWAALAGVSALPSPGVDFRCFYLCNTSVQGQQPDIWRALLEHIYVEHQEAGYHFFTFDQRQGDPLAPALRGFFTRSLAFHLYAVTAEGTPVPAWDSQQLTGFEMALA